MAENSVVRARIDERTKAFKRDFQRVAATARHRDLENVLPALIALLATDTPLPQSTSIKRDGVRPDGE